MKKLFYITTPIYYVNDTPHIGHSYTNIACDVLARFKRLTGYEVYYLTGTDEHGQKVAQVAQAQNKTPQELVDEVMVKFKNLWTVLEISYDDFIRTTEKRHEEVVQMIFNELYRQGDIYPGQYEGWYCVPCETFWLETQIEKGLCPDCGRPLERLSEKTYFFRMSKYEKALLAHLEKNPEFVRPAGRYHEIVNFVKSGLKDLSISRPKTRISWGIPCPFDQEQTIYVWFDALINYVSALGYKNHPDLFQKFWPADVQMIGKDILKFHAVIWPAMLLGVGAPLPKKVFAHGWWTVEGQKMSKSKGNVIDPYKVMAKFGVAAYRYFLLREVTFGQDGDFSQTALLARYQADLANNLGNLLNRTLTMLEKYFAGVVPAPAPSVKNEELQKLIEDLFPSVEEKINSLSFSQALENIWEIIDWSNKYIEKKAPWQLAKSNKTELAQVLYTLADVLRIIALYIQPFMPSISQSMWEQLGLTGELTENKLQNTKTGQFPGGVQVRKGLPLFPKIDSI